MAIKRGNGHLTLSGTVKKGIGKGRYFMRQEGYRKQFIKKLGIDPFHGTLNIRVSGKSARTLESIKRKRGITIKGFRKESREFGGAKCYRAEISGVKCALVVPKLSTHRNIAEILSSDKLRTALRLKEGSRVSVSVFA